MNGSDHSKGVSQSNLPRAAAQELVGPNAYIGGRLGVWYISGAHHWHDLSSDLLQSKDLTQGKVKKIFSKLDFVVEQAFMSDTTSNNLGNSLLAWYLDGTLKLAGFIQSPIVGEIFLRSALQRSNLSGYLISGHAKLTRFDEAMDGAEAFVTFVCPDNFDVGIPSQSTLMSITEGGVRRTLLMALLSWSEYLERRGQLSSFCSKKDEVRGTLPPVNRELLLAQHQKSDKTMVFDRREPFQ